MIVPSSDVVSYQANRAALLTPVSNGVVNPSTLEYRSNGPVSVPAKLNVINIVMLLTVLL